MPAIAEPIATSPEIEDIQTALRISDYLNQSRQVDISKKYSLGSSEKRLLDYISDLALTLRFVPLEQKLVRMSDLRPNWDTYGAEPPSDNSKYRAQSILAFLLQKKVVPTDIVASSEGGVAISFTSANNYADIECLNSGEILAVTVAGREEPNVWEVEASEAAIAQTVERIRAHVAA
jgi:hypothetical protein